MDFSKLGYDKPLYILPFDHRAFFARSLFNAQTTDDLNEEQKHVLREFKMLIYKGFKQAVESGVPKSSAAILCDEEFGGEVLIDAKNNGFLTILTLEKSGVKELELRYEDFEDHIQRFKPPFVKILLNYNPSDDQSLKVRQKNKLKIISDFSHNNGYKFLLEVLVSPTKEQLAKSSGSVEEFDENLRPDLTVNIMTDFQKSGIEPDVWKIEGFKDVDAYKKVTKVMKDGGREKVSLVVLGRSESESKVETWLKAGSKVPGVIGFAVGRTVFWDSLQRFYKGEISKAETIEKIGSNFLNFYKIFTS